MDTAYLDLTDELKVACIWCAFHCIITDIMTILDWEILVFLILLCSKNAQ